MKFNRQTLLLMSMAFAVSSAIAQGRITIEGASSLGSTVIPAIVSIDPASLSAPIPWRPGDPVTEVPLRNNRERRPPLRELRPVGIDPILQRQIDTASSTVPDPTFGMLRVNRDGIDFTGKTPPDTVGDIGNNHYVQAVNSGTGIGGTRILVLDKLDGTTVQEFELAELAVGSGTGCADSRGDPVVVFDETASNGLNNPTGKWMISEFTSNTLCIYISQTDSPVSGQWFLYEFGSASGRLPDYPKYAVWPDGYYVGANESLFPNSGPTQYVFDRARMIQGLAARPVQFFSAPRLPGFGFQHMMPVDWDGELMPPEGTPGLFIRHRDTEIHGPVGLYDEDQLELFEFSVDFDLPANSTFSGPILVGIEEFDSEFCDLIFSGCLPQPNTSQTLFALLQPMMWRAQYRNFGAYGSIVANMVTDVTGTDVAGVRWFELRDPGDGWQRFQEGIAADNDGVSRWMGSAAQDKSGDIAVAYNVVDPISVYPGIRYNGRKATDPQGSLTQGEVIVVGGTEANNNNRYGDYSALTVDPVDSCTFWYTSEYNNMPFWSTRIASFRFDACGEPGFTLGALNSRQQVCANPGQLADVTINTASLNDYDGLVKLKFDQLPSGVTGDFHPSSVYPGESSIAQFNVDSTTPTGINLLTILATVNDAADREVTLEVDVVAARPGVSTLFFPTQGAQSIDTSPVVFWSEADEASGYLVEVAADPDFQHIIYTDNTQQSITRIKAILEPLTEYFWRVTAYNVCGEGVVSAVSSFTTANMICINPEVLIPPANPAGVSTIISISELSTLQSLKVEVSSDHTFVGDMSLSLQHAGTTVMLMDRPGFPVNSTGCNIGGVSAVFDDDSTVPVESVCESQPPAIFGYVSPDQPLAAFSGMDFDGEWTLTATDIILNDTGLINRWCLIPETGPADRVFVDGFE